MAFSRAKTFACPKKTPTVQVRTNQDLNVWSFQLFFFKHGETKIYTKKGGMDKLFSRADKGWAVKRARPSKKV